MTIIEVLEFYKVFDKPGKGFWFRPISWKGSGLALEIIGSGIFAKVGKETIANQFLFQPMWFANYRELLEQWEIVTKEQILSEQ